MGLPYKIKSRKIRRRRRKEKTAHITADAYGAVGHRTNEKQHSNVCSCSLLIVIGIIFWLGVLIYQRAHDLKTKQSKINIIHVWCVLRMRRKWYVVCACSVSNPSTIDIDDERHPSIGSINPKRKIMPFYV